MADDVMPLAIVTGGGRGIGASISKRLATDGYRVLLTYNQSSNSAEMIVESIRSSGGDAVAVKVDCSNPADIMILADHPWCKLGVSALVINHGAYVRTPSDNLTISRLRETMKINFEGSFLVWESLSKFLSKDARIVVIGSQLGIKGSPHGADYSASKAALHLWARSLAQAVGRIGQRVNIVAPGYIDTDLLSGDSAEKRLERESEVPLKRMGTPDDIGGVVSFLVSPDSSYITGAIIHVNGGLFLP